MEQILPPHSWFEFPTSKLTIKATERMRQIAKSIFGLALCRAQLSAGGFLKAILASDQSSFFLSPNI
jgi:hypothetical protein